MTDSILGDVLDRTTIAYLLLAGLIGAGAIAWVRSIKASRLETRRRAGAGPRSQFEKKRRRR